MASCLRSVFQCKLAINRSKQSLHLKSFSDTGSPCIVISHHDLRAEKLTAHVELALVPNPFLCLCNSCLLATLPLIILNQTDLHRGSKIIGHLILHQFSNFHKTSKKLTCALNQTTQHKDLQFTTPQVDQSSNSKIIAVQVVMN